MCCHATDVRLEYVLVESRCASTDARSWYIVHGKGVFVVCFGFLDVGPAHSAAAYTATSLWPASATPAPPHPLATDGPLHRHCQNCRFYHASYCSFCCP